MSPSLPDIPLIPPELETAAQQGKLVIFVGAGVSRLAKGPSWEEFAERLLKELADKEVFSFGDLDLLRHLDARKKISIAMDLCRQNQYEPGLRTLLQDQVSAQDAPPIYRDLYAIGTPFVTTNYDEWLDVLAETPYPVVAPIELAVAERADSVAAVHTKVFYKIEHLTIDKLTTPGAVVHLHGSVRDPKTMILTARHYLEHYDNENVKAFLVELFKRYVVLFVGYGLEEDEILEHVLRKSGRDRETRHFRLIGRYSHEDRLTKFLADYSVNHCGVQLLEFGIDRKNHPQLSAVIGEWARRLGPQVKSQLYLEKIRIIDEALL